MWGEKAGKKFEQNILWVDDKNRIYSYKETCESKLIAR